MAEVGLAPASLASQEQYVSAPQNGADFLYESEDPAKRYTYQEDNLAPTNKYGIAYPLFTLDCTKSTRDHRDINSCIYTRHHLHSSAPLLKAAGIITSEFKDLATLSVWTPRCRHNQHHDDNDINTYIPSIEIMEQAIYEEKIIRALSANTNSVRGLNKAIENPLTQRSEACGQIKAREKLLAQRPELLGKLGEIQVTPEELITGALILVAPSHARSRLRMGSGYVLTGTISRPEIPAVINSANSMMSANALSLQTGVDEVRLAA